MRLVSCASAVQNTEIRELRARAARRAPTTLGCLALCILGCLHAQAACADQQRDPDLREVVARAIAQAECFPDKYESAVWYKMMEPRLRRVVASRDERLEILKVVFCESRRAGETRLPPGLMMGLIEVESRFDRWAVSASGAVGLMQVMPFWPERLGMHRYELTHIAPGIRMGTAILRFYLQRERYDVRKALARYNGSIGRRDYPDKVITRWSHWNGGDDLGIERPHQPVVKASGR